MDLLNDILLLFINIYSGFGHGEYTTHDVTFFPREREHVRYIVPTTIPTMATSGAPHSMGYGPPPQQSQTHQQPLCRRVSPLVDFETVHSSRNGYHCLNAATKIQQPTNNL